MIRAVDGRVPIAIVPNGVDLEAFRPGESISDEGPLRLLCVGRLIERKGQQHLIEAVGRLTGEDIDVTLELVGTGDAEAALKAQVRRLGVEDRVQFAGYVPRERIAARYAAAHVFVLASYNEGMSVATLEAMAAGLPVVVTRTGGTAELVEEGVNGFTFAWADVESLTGDLRRLGRDRGIARQMGAPSRVKASHFSWDAAAEHYCELMRRIQGRRPGGEDQTVGPAQVRGAGPSDCPSPTPAEGHQ
jgi:glycosyltransferase involved in cell wall biosynthesis